MDKTTFKPTFKVQNTEKAEKLAKMSVTADILGGHHQFVANKHKHQVALD